MEVGPQLVKDCRTWNRRYYHSNQLELPTAFRIYSSQTRRVVRQFPAVDPVKNEILAAGNWNPKNDDLLIIEHRTGMNEMEGVDVYRISDGKTLRTFRGPAFTWAPDGSSLIVFSGGKFRFEPVAQDSVK